MEDNANIIIQNVTFHKNYGYLGGGGIYCISSSPVLNGVTLQENSPCIDAGTAFIIWEGDTLVDFISNQYIGEAPDMGAFEFDPTVSIAFPLVDNSKSSTFRLKQVYPNPFHHATNISFTLHAPAMVKLEIFDQHGKLIRTLIRKKKKRGSYTISWNGKDNHGRKTSGIYFCRLVADKEYIASQKFILK